MIASLTRSREFIEELIAQEKERGIAADKIILAGFSQGCAMTLHTGLRHPETLAGLVCLSGYLPLADKLSDERHDANAQTAIFMAHGTQDPVVAIERAQASAQQLHALGQPLQWKTYPMPHSVCLEEIRDIANFLKQVFA